MQPLLGNAKSAASQALKRVFSIKNFKCACEDKCSHKHLFGGKNIFRTRVNTIGHIKRLERTNKYFKINF